MLILAIADSLSKPWWLEGRLSVCSASRTGKPGTWTFCTRHLPEEIAKAAAEFAEVQRAKGDALVEEWLNNGPARLKDVLPPGWKDRLQPAFRGKALVLSVLGRSDILKDKLFALCDRGTDLTDCLALAPTAEEISEAQVWIEVQDGNPTWPDHVRKTLDDLRGRLGHGV